MNIEEQVKNDLKLLAFGESGIKASIWNDTPKFILYVIEGLTSLNHTMIEIMRENKLTIFSVFVNVDKTLTVRIERKLKK